MFFLLAPADAHAATEKTPQYIDNICVNILPAQSAPAVGNLVADPNLKPSYVEITELVADDISITNDHISVDASETAYWQKYDPATGSYVTPADTTFTPDKWRYVGKVTIDPTGMDTIASAETVYIKIAGEPRTS